MAHHNHSEPLPIFGQGGENYPNRPWHEVNPNNAPVGPYTGRCARCGSNDLWDDCSAYGCNNCGAVYSN